MTIDDDPVGPPLDAFSSDSKSCLCLWLSRLVVRSAADKAGASLAVLATLNQALEPTSEPVRSLKEPNRGESVRTPHSKGQLKRQRSYDDTFEFAPTQSSKGAFGA